MNRRKYNDNWMFWKDKDTFALFWDIPENAEKISLPHDAMIQSQAFAESKNGGTTGYRDGEVYIYTKKFFVSEMDKEKTLFLEFEGIYMNAFVYINGEFAGKNPFGYTTFRIYLNDYVKYGEENDIRVQVRCGAMKNSRWYSGAGIYRDVYFLESGKTYIVPEGVRIKTERANKNEAVLYVDTEIKSRNHIPQTLVLETIILDKDGNETACERTPLVLFEQEERHIKQRIYIETPMLWNDENPVLYKCISRLYEKKSSGNRKSESVAYSWKNDTYRQLDENSENFGIRTLQVDAKNGFCVNGVQTKLRGACIHHDSGLLGTATYEDAQYRQIKLLKDAGFNAVRMSHHPMAPAMLRACDELGMYVMDETFDMWNQCKTEYDYSLYFQEWWKTDLTAMVKKDYNHPCVVMYSVGNEIPEIGTGKGARLCQEMCEMVKSLDDTRFVLASMNGIFASSTELNIIMQDIIDKHLKEGLDVPVTKFDGDINDFMAMQEAYMDEIVTHDIVSQRLEMACASTDIAGYNYMTARYEMDGVTYPNRVIVGSETYPPDIALNWNIVKKNAHVIGDFTWTGWDYRGEAGIGISGYEEGEGGFGAKFPAQLGYCGDIDITGFRRPTSYYREIVFEKRNQPYIAVQDPAGYGRKIYKTPWVLSDAVSSWTWSGFEGKGIVVEVYSSAEEVELICNGKSVGKKESGIRHNYRTLFELTYEPGELLAIGYEKGKETGRMQLVTAGKEYEVILTQEITKNCDRERELIFINVELKDKNGNLVTDCDQELYLKTAGNIECLAFGSADPKSYYGVNEGVTKTYHGRAQIILKRICAKENEGQITVCDKSNKKTILYISSMS